MQTNGDAPLKVVPVRHVRRWIGGVVILLLVAMLGHSIFSKIPNGPYVCDSQGDHCRTLLGWRFRWDVVFHFFTTRMILHGLLMTLELTVLAMAVGIAIGVLVTLLRLSPSRVLSVPAWSYTWFFRGTPVYVQLLFWFNVAALFPQISLGIPFTHITFVTFALQGAITPFVAALVGLSLNEGAYMSEIVRGGIQAVDEGQVEASLSLGLTRLQTMRMVVLPQAMRVIIPPTGNEVISMLKTTSLASALALVELLKAAQNIYSANYEIIPLLIVASLWYLTVTTLLSIGQYYIERHFARGSLRTLPPTPLQRMRTDLARLHGVRRSH
jgi:polar amino acid transport system permease protein